MTTFERPRRNIKSYVCRSRMTNKQRLAIEDFWPEFGIDNVTEALDLSKVFMRNAPVILEIGFGMGDSLIQLAKSYPEVNFMGIDVHRSGIGAALIALQEQGLTNVKIFCADAIEILEKCFYPETFAAILLFFPDPWPKRRHHKRRIVQSPFVELVHSRLQSGGYFHLATDVTDYANHMLEVVKSHPGFHNRKYREIQFSYLDRPKTKFELRGEDQGNLITDLVFIKGE